MSGRALSHAVPLGVEQVRSRAVADGQGYHQARYPTSRSTRWCQAYLRPDLRGDPRCPQDLVSAALYHFSSTHPNHHSFRRTLLTTASRTSSETRSPTLSTPSERPSPRSTSSTPSSDRAEPSTVSVLKCTADPYEMEEQGRTSRASASVASSPSCLEILGGLLVVPFYHTPLTTLFVFVLAFYSFDSRALCADASPVCFDQVCCCCCGVFCSACWARLKEMSSPSLEWHNLFCVYAMRWATSSQEEIRAWAERV